MKVLHLSFSKYGGAGIAAERLNNALNENGINSKFAYLKPYSKSTAYINFFEKKINGFLNILFSKVFKFGTLNILPSRLIHFINKEDIDIVHLHWINAETISIEQISKIKKPLVWTFHDMWPISGTETYISEDSIKKNQFIGISRWVWKRKLKNWSNLKVEICCPSLWMVNCAKESPIFKGNNFHVLPNILDLNIFKPKNKIMIRKKLNLPLSKKILLFGAHDVNDDRKGIDLLFKALEKIKYENLFIVIFGNYSFKVNFEFPVKWFGYQKNVEDIVDLYNCADAVCVPSRQETFGQTASEPQACGVPVVAFNSSGIKEVIRHKKTGYLAKPFVIEDLIYGITWVLDNSNNLSSKAREFAVKQFHKEKITNKIIEIYKNAGSGA